MEDGAFHATEAGTPQGGVISPLLLNIALHGMEAALGVFSRRQGNRREARVVRYADDFVVFCETREDAERAKDRLLPPWLAERGLRLSAEKTRIVHLTEGFDFLGFNVSHYLTSGTTRTGRKLLIKPSQKAVMAKRKELRELWYRLKGHSVRQILWKLNPIIRGWANYYRTGVSSKVFTGMDTWMFRRACCYVRAHAPQQALALAPPALLGQVAPAAAGPLGVWRQAYRGLPAEVRLVQDRAPHPGARHGFPGRPTSPGILVVAAPDQPPAPERQ